MNFDYILVTSPVIFGYLLIELHITLNTVDCKKYVL